MAMKVEIQSRKFIKPLIPTPQTHRHYKLGFLDEFAFFMNIPVVLFFSPNTTHNPRFVVQLEKSLEKTLTHLYPLAGRYDEKIQTVECNDDGVEFIHAKVNVKLQEVVGSEADAKLVDEFIPFMNRSGHEFSEPLLSIQVTEFECGGVVLGLSASHKIVDGSTLWTFMNEWAAMNREANEIQFTGSGFNSSYLFPARGASAIQLPFVSGDMSSKLTRKTISFSESEISNIREKLALANGKNNTRRWSKVQLVVAILSKAFIDVDRATHKYSRDLIVIQPLSLREKMASLIPKDSCGNLWSSCTTNCGILETTSELADLLSDSIKKAVNNYSKVRHDSEEGQSMVWDSTLPLPNFTKSTHLIAISSWCKFPIYEANFGFGKPTRVVHGNVPLKHAVNLMDDAGGNGVEAHVMLDVEDVLIFEESVKANAFRA